MRGLSSLLDKHHKMTEQQLGSDTPKTNFRLLTRPERGTPHSKMSPASLSTPSSLFHPQLSCEHSELYFRSFDLPTMLPCSTMWRPRGMMGSRSSSPGQVRRELITFQCCFSTLCKEQSVLIGINYRRMLIQSHADRLQRERITGFSSDSLMSPDDK